MNPPEHTVSPSTDSNDAIEMMQRVRIRHLLVVEDDELVGVVTDHDLRKADGVVRDVMATQLLTATPDMHAAQAARVMVENKINCLPVLKDDKVVGILTSSDLLAALVDLVDADYESELD
ncbi:MAG: CBS domain-containing protein [Polyangiaceae bacterium]